MKFTYATRSLEKVETAKETLLAQAARAGHRIVGFHTETTSAYPQLQNFGDTRGVEHPILTGCTTQAELDALKPSENTE